jgi:hypothetical protein
MPWRITMQPYSRLRACAALLLLGAALFLNHNLRAQTSDAAAPSAAAPSFLRYGLFGGVAVNNHFANFSEFVDITTDTGYPFGNTGSLLSYYVGGLVEVPIIDRFGVALRASVANVSGFTLSVRENFFGATSRAIIISRILTINSLPMLAGEPYLTYRILDGLTLYAGARFGYLVNQGFHFEERLLDSGYVFLDPNRQPSNTRNVQNGNIPQLNSLNIALSGGVSIEIPIDASKHWFLAAEGFYMYGLTQVANGLVLRQPTATFNGLSATRTVPTSELGTERDPSALSWPRETSTGSWLMNNLRAGISLRYAP